MPSYWDPPEIRGKPALDEHPSLLRTKVWIAGASRTDEPSSTAAFGFVIQLPGEPTVEGGGLVPPTCAERHPLTEDERPFPGTVRAAEWYACHHVLLHAVPPGRSIVLHTSNADIVGVFHGRIPFASRAKWWLHSLQVDIESAIHCEKYYAAGARTVRGRIAGQARVYIRLTDRADSLPLLTGQHVVRVVRITPAQNRRALRVARTALVAGAKVLRDK